MRNATVAVALAMLLAGCGGGAPQSGSGGSTVTTPPPTTSGSSEQPKPPAVTPPVSLSDAAPVVPPGVQEVPKEKVDANALSDVYRREAYVFNDGRDIEVFGVAGGCKEAKAEVTAQSADAVHITLVTILRQPSGTMCTQELRPVPLTVRLDAPLGDRRLVLETREESA